MAVAAFGGFSIREYTAGVRKTDANKCWPFGRDVRESLLPPIQCRRHRWWSSELQTAGSARGMEQEHVGVEADGPAVVDRRQKVCDREPSRSSRDAKALSPHVVLVLPSKVSRAEEDGALKIKSLKKPKARTPKKRSIQGLFPLAPPVEGRGEENKGDNGNDVIDEISITQEDDDGEESDWCSTNERMKCKKERTKIRVRKKTKAKEEKALSKRENRKRRFQTKDQKRKNSFADNIAGEVAICKSRKQSLASVPQLPCGSTVISWKTKNSDRVIQRIDKPEGKNAVRNANFLKHFVQPEEIDVHQRDASLAEIRRQNIDPAVSSAAKVDLHGQNSRTGHGGKLIPSTLGSRHMQSLYRVFSDVLTAATVVHSSSESKDQAVTERVSRKKIPSSSISQKSVDVPDATKTEIGGHMERKTGFVVMVDLNNPAEICRSPVETDASVQEESILQNVTVNDRAETVLTARSLPSTSAVATRTLPLVGNSSSELPSSAVTKKRKKSLHDSPDDDAYSCSPEKSMMRTINESWTTGELPKNDSLSREIHFERSFSGDIITGLPLNSQGEVLRMQSRGKKGSEQVLAKRKRGPAPRADRLSVHNFIEMFSPDLHKQRITQAQIRHEPERKYSQRVGNQNASENPFRTSFCNLNELGLPGEAQRPTMRLMGTNVTLGKGNKEQRGSREVNKLVDRTAEQSADPRSHRPLVGGEGNSGISGHGRHPLSLSLPHAPKAWLRNELIELGVEAATNVHQNLVINSGTWKHSEQLPNPWSHLRISSAQLPSDDFTRPIVKEENPKTSGMHYPGFPRSCSSVRSSQNGPEPMFTYLTSFDFVDKTGKYSSTIGSSELLQANNIGEQPPDYGKRVANNALNLNDAANDGSWRSWSTKPSSVAKHTFKPSLKMDLDKTVAVHSTVPYSSENGSNKVPALLEKSVRVYQL